MTDEIFCVEWGTGGIKVRVHSYFTTASLAQIRKLFKLAQKNCTEEQQKALLDALKRAIDKQKELLDALTELAQKKADLLNSFYGTNRKPEVGQAEKLIARELARLRKVVEILREEKWLW